MSEGTPRRDKRAGHDPTGVSKWSFVFGDTETGIENRAVVLNLS